MRELLGISLLVYLVYFLATFLAASLGIDRLLLDRTENAVTYVVVPVIFMLLLSPLIRTGHLPPIAIGTREPRLLPWAVLIGMSMWITKWLLHNLIGFGELLFSGTPIQPGPFTATWACQWPAAEIPTTLKLVVLIPLVEELCFRGLILGAFLRRGRPVAGIVVSSVLFATYHPDFIETFIVGSLFGLMYWHTRQLGLVIVAHMVHNAIVALQQYCVELDWIPEPIFWLVALLLAAIWFGIAAWLIQRLPDHRHAWVAENPNSSAES